MKRDFVRRAAVNMALIMSVSTVVGPAMQVQAQDNDAEVVCEVQGKAAADGDVAKKGVEINEANFPDAKFREYVSEKCDKDDDGMLSDAEISGMTVIDIATGSNAMYKSVQDLTGIEYFTELKTLRCGQSKVAKMDVSKNMKLEYLKCNETPLTSLDVSKNTALKELTCHGTEITALDLTNNEALEKVWCYNTAVASLDISHCPKLKLLNVENTKLTYLDVSENKELTSFWAEDTPLSVLKTGDNTNFPETNLSTELHIEVQGDTFDITEYIPAADVTKIEVKSGATLTGSIMSGYTAGTPIVYTYKDGKATIEVTIHLEMKAEEELAVNEENFPDYYFRNYVSEKCDSDKNGSLSKSELEKVTEIKVNSTSGYKNIKSLTGIEHFTKLTKLDCSNQSGVKALDVSGFCELAQLNFKGTGVSEIDLSQNTKLTQLYCSKHISSLDISANDALRTISCAGAPIEEIDVTDKPELEYLYVDETNITSLNIQNNKKLKVLGIKKTKIEYLEASNNPVLERIECDGAPIYGIVLAENNKFSKAGKIASSSYELKVPDGSFELEDFFEQMDVSRVSAVSGGKVENGVVSGYTEDTPVVCKFYAGNNKLNAEAYVELTLNLKVVPGMEVINHIPEISARDVELTVGDKFEAFAKVTAKDTEDGDITSKVEIHETDVDTTTAGNYKVTYKVTDSKGATAYKTIRVTVKEEAKDTLKEPSTGHKEQSEIPKTADAAPIGMTASMMAVSAAVLAAFGVKKGKKQKNREM